MADNKDIENQKELNSEVEKNLSFEEEILFILNKRRGISGESLKDQQDINNVLADQTKQLKFQISEKRTIKSLSDKISRIASSAYAINIDELGLDRVDFFNLNIEGCFESMIEAEKPELIDMLIEECNNEIKNK